MLDILDEFPVLVSYLGRLEQRPAFAKVYGGKVQRFPDPHPNTERAGVVADATSR